MSGPIKRNIGLTKHRLKNYVTQVNEIMDKPVQHSPMVYITELKNHNKRIGRTIELLMKENDKWSDLIISLPKTERELANEEYEEYTSADDNFLSIVKTAHDAVDRIEEIISLEEARLKENESINNSISEFNSATGETKHINVTLPKLKLPSFSGDSTTWPTFWQSYEAAIHKQSLPAVQKMTYLLSCLTGAAAREVQGFAVTNENYEIIISLLRERYGDKEKLLERLHSELITLPNANESNSSLNELLHSIERICRQIQSLDGEEDNPFLTTSIKSKLPKNILTKLNEILFNKSQSWSTKFIREELKHIISWREQANETIQTSQNIQDTKQRSYNSFNKNKYPDKSNESKTFQKNNYTRNIEQTRNFTITIPENKTPNSKCFLCDAGFHWSQDCKKFPKREDRVQRLKEQNRCFICLKVGHSSNECRTNKVCWNRECRGRHHQIICPKQFSSANQQFQPEKPISKEANLKYSTNIKPNKSKILGNKDVKQQTTTAITEQTTTETTVNTAMDVRPREALLMTKQVQIKPFEKDSKTFNAVVFFDSGSQTSFITKEMAQRMKLKKLAEGELEVYTFNQQQPTRFDSPKYGVSIRLENNEWQDLILNATENITNPLKTINLTDNNIKQTIKLKKITDINEKVKPDILIGIGEFWQFLKRVETINKDLNIIHTTLGPIICGKTTIISEKAQNGVHSTISAQAIFAVPSNDKIQNFWNLEGIGITDDHNEDDDETAMIMFQNTLKQIDGRYQASWPWKNKNPNLPTNFQLSYCRLKSTINRLKNTPELLQKYCDVFKEQLQLNIIEEAPSQTKGLEHFLPHQAIIRLDKTYTKLRVVFDASAHLKDQLSLNDCLFRGPVMLPDLAGLLLRFRIAQTVILADIEKAFLMIELKEEDRNVTKFLWLRDPNQPLINENIVTYRFQRVPFGVTSSPFILAATIQHHLNKYDTDLAKEIKSNIYVDNILMTTNSPKEGHQKYLDAKNIFKEAKMNLREFISNSDELNNKFVKEDRLDKENPKVLGVPWDLKADTIRLRIMPKQNHDKVNITRRTVLKELASTFDPLGLIAPCVLQAKIFFQTLWENEQKWDTTLSEKDTKKWSELLKDYEEKEIVIPRQTQIGKNAQLHAFVDASKQAYAALIYVRSDNNNEHKSFLLFTKNRLKPNKGMTIPRMELMAILIGVRALNFAKKQMRVPIEKTYLWSDSQCALSWIATATDKTKFVKNRLNEIRKYRDISYNYVPTHDNPADVSTRGSSINDLTQNKTWWHGPQWLYQIISTLTQTASIKLFSTIITNYFLIHLSLFKIKLLLFHYFISIKVKTNLTVSNI